MLFQGRAKLGAREDSLFALHLFIDRHGRLRAWRCVARRSNGAGGEIRVDVKAGVECVVVEHGFRFAIELRDVGPTVYDVLGRLFQHHADHARGGSELGQRAQQCDSAIHFGGRQWFQRVRVGHGCSSVQDWKRPDGGSYRK